MDVFIEQLVSRKSGARDATLKSIIIAATASVSVFLLYFALAVAAFMPFLMVVSITLMSGGIWLASHLIKGLNIEYEYILTNKELDIDKIIGRRKRKRLITLNLATAEEFDLYRTEFNTQTDATVAAHDNTFSNIWYIVGKHNTHGKVIVLFSPSDEFLIHLNNAVPHKVKNSKITSATKMNMQNESDL